MESKREATPDEGSDFWISFPSKLIGRRIGVQWEKGKMYYGKVTRYSSSNQMHTVKYDDGEEKMYNLRQKTFKIVRYFSLNF